MRQTSPWQHHRNPSRTRRFSSGEDQAILILGQRTVALLCYGVQGPRPVAEPEKTTAARHQSGLRDKGRGWDLAQQDGCEAVKTLFPMAEPPSAGRVIPYLLSDAGNQKEQGGGPQAASPDKGKALYFSHASASPTRPDRRGSSRRTLT